MSQLSKLSGGEISSRFRFKRSIIWKAVASSLVVFLTACLGISFMPGSAYAASSGPGYYYDGFIGAYVAESDGRQVYCMEVLAYAPINRYTSGPTTVDSLNDYDGNTLSEQSLAELNYVMARWGDSDDPSVTTAVQMFVWAVADPNNYSAKGGDEVWLMQTPPEDRDQVSANLQTMYAEAAKKSSVTSEISLNIEMSSSYEGTLTVLTEADSASGMVSLSNAKFADGTTMKLVGSGEYEIIGTPTDGLSSYQITASGSFSATGLGAKVDLYLTPGFQRLLGYSSDSTQSLIYTTPDIALNFQPTITPQVKSQFVQKGDASIALLVAETMEGEPWIQAEGSPVSLTATGTLYGPFASAPTESEVPPTDAPVVGTETLLLDHGTGQYQSSGSLKTDNSGFYTWVWNIDKDDQGDNAQYVRESFTSRFGQDAGTYVTPFQPVGISTVTDKIVSPGTQVSAEVEIWAKNGSWLQVDGESVSVVLTGTLYQVPGALPPSEKAEIPDTAIEIGSVDLIATGPGTYTSDAVRLPDSGFVTWVWEAETSKQSPEYADYIVSGWEENYGDPLASSSIRRSVSVTSEIDDYAIYLSDSAVSAIDVIGFPDDHGEFEGDGYWGADIDTMTHIVYGPISEEEELTDDLDLDSIPVLTEIDTPAKNGTYQVGSEEGDAVRPSEAGWYVVISTFAGDDRVEEFASMPTESSEQFFVSPESLAPASVSSKAQENAMVGQAFTDVATISGNIPAGATLTFEAYGPYQVAPEAEEEVEPFFIGEPISITGPGEVESQPVTVDSEGQVFWIETLKDEDGQVLAQGFIGAPDSTTKILPYDFEVTTKATSNALLGEPATATATITGDVPPEASLIFEAFRQDGNTPTCESANRVASTATNPLPIAQAGEYISDPVVFTTVGTYFWVETVIDSNGKIWHKGECGAEGETTIVTASMTDDSTVPGAANPTTPATDTSTASSNGGASASVAATTAAAELARTGMNWGWTLQVFLGVAITGGIAVAIAVRRAKQ